MAKTIISSAIGDRSMAGLSKYKAVADEEASEAFCVVADALLDALDELEKLYAMTGKLDNLTEMKLKDMKRRIREAIANIC